MKFLIAQDCAGWKAVEKGGKKWEFFQQVVLKRSELESGSEACGIPFSVDYGESLLWN